MQALPRLSLIIGARNDQYMDNFKWRFQTSLNYLADNLQRLGRLDDVEVVVTDWGSDVPLDTVLSLNRAAKRIVRFVLVPPDLARQLQGDSEFPIVLAQNVAVRRSRGEYIAQTDSDILLPIEFLERLFAILDDGYVKDVPVDATVVVCKRLHIPWVCGHWRLSLPQLDWFVHRLRCFLHEHPITTIPFEATAFCMMHRRMWGECGGYDEQLIHWGGMEVDLGLRVTRRYPCVSLNEFGVTLFHLEHYHPSSERRTTRKINRMPPDNVYCPNDEGWGLAKHVLQEFTYSVSAQEIEPADTDGNQRMQVNFRFTLIIAQVLLSAALREIKRAPVHLLRRYVPWLLPFLSTWRHRTRFVWSNLKGLPLRHWPSVPRRLWAEWQHRRKSTGTGAAPPVELGTQK